MTIASKQIVVRFNPTSPSNTISTVVGGEEGFYCVNSVLAGDGDIYAVNIYGQAWKVDTTSSDYTRIGVELIQKDTVGIPIVKADKCICWPPSFANHCTEI